MLTTKPTDNVRIAHRHRNRHNAAPITTTPADTTPRIARVQGEALQG
jgi:hypothetical protein